MSIKLVLILWSVLGPLVASGGTWLALTIRNKAEVAGALAGERSRQVGICARQLADQANLIAANTMAGVGQAGVAADAVSATPEDRAAVVALCRSDRSCRDRGALP